MLISRYIRLHEHSILNITLIKHLLRLYLGNHRQMKHRNTDENIRLVQPEEEVAERKDEELECEYFCEVIFCYNISICQVSISTCFTPFSHRFS